MTYDVYMKRDRAAEHIRRSIVRVFIFPENLRFYQVSCP
jgi:hypothetical protein